MISPLGIDQAARSFLAQNGPPGCTSSTCKPAAPCLYKRIPALRFFIFLFKHTSYSGAHFYILYRHKRRSLWPTQMVKLSPIAGITYFLSTTPTTLVATGCPRSNGLYST